MLAWIFLGLNCFQARNNPCAFTFGKSSDAMFLLPVRWLDAVQCLGEGWEWGKCGPLRWLAMNSLKRRHAVSAGLSTKPSEEFLQNLKHWSLIGYCASKQMVCKSPLIYLLTWQMLTACVLGGMGQRETRHEPYPHWLLGGWTRTQDPLWRYVLWLPSLTEPGLLPLNSFVSQSALLLEIVCRFAFHVLSLEYQPPNSWDLHLFSTLTSVSGIVPRTY